MRVSSDRQPTEKKTAKRDIRSGNQTKRWNVLEFNWLRGLLLICSDVLGLGIVWKASLSFTACFKLGRICGFNGIILGFCGGNCDSICLSQLLSWRVAMAQLRQTSPNH
jgi:hypothetical protein